MSESYEHQKYLSRLFQELEREIVRINRDHISEVTGRIDKNTLLKIANTVSSLRAKYMSEIISLSNIDKEEIDSKMIEKLQHCRIAYQEALDGFGAMRYAVEKGYINLVT